ncbi:MAG: LamG-like jellyroll fold domain-containing protein, partial [Bacteroidota bacterium]
SNVTTSLQCGATVSFTPSSQNLDTHCGQDGYTGAERIYQINWDGGRFIATLEEKTPGQELILYSSCDPNSCIRIEPNQIDVALSAGPYYLVVDGKNGAKGRYTLSLTNPDDPNCILPDFKAESIEGDNCVQPGDVATYTATVGNDGDRAFTQEELAVSFDRFYLAKDREAFNNFQEITETSIPSQQVRPGDTYTTTGSISIPDNIEPGDYVIIFFADADEVVTEAFAGGNIITYPISIGNNNGPDYVPSNLQAPNAANPEEDIRIRVTLANEGNANGSASGGKDKIFLNTSSSLGSGNPIELLPTTNLPTRDLSANQRVTITRTVQIPANTAAGDYFLIFHQDADNIVDECNDQNNTVSTRIKIRVGNPDYVLEDFVVDGKTELTVKQGQKLSGSVVTKNQGNGPGTTFTDGKYYYSTNTSFNPNADILLGNNRDSIEPLEAGDKRTEGETVRMPNSVPVGPGYILYVVDVPNKIKESNEQNNVAFVRINVEERPNPGSGTGSGFEANFTVDDTRPCKGTEVTFTPNVLSRVLPDQGPNDLDGAIRNFGLPSTAGPQGFDKALNFDGNDDFVDLPDGLLTEVRSFTFETWYFHKENREQARIFDFGSSTTDWMIFIPVERNTKRPRVIMRSADRQELEVTEALQLNRWYHMAFVLDTNGSQNNARVYINGVLKGQATFTFYPEDMGNFEDMWLARSQFSQDPNLEGSLDEIRLWNTARTEEQINENKDKELDGNEDGLIAYYDMNQPLASGDASYNWSFPGGTPSSSTEAIPTVTYAQAGSYDVGLSITADGQSDTESKTEFMNVQSCDPNELDADFIVDNSNPCEGEEVQFTNTTTGLQSGQTVTYAWDIPGGAPATSSEENPKVTFNEAGRYRVSLTVTQNGISNTTKSNIKVEVCNDEVEPDWPVMPTGENHTIIVRNDIPINVDGQTLEAGDFLGVFFKNDEEEICGGKVKWTGENTSVAAFGNDITERGKNGFKSGESFSWRIWKSATETEYAVNATYEPTNFLYTHQGEYANDGISGLTSLSDGLSETQTLTLTPEWNMISSYIKPGNPDIAGIFSSVASSISLVKDEDGKAYVPSFGINLIEEWDIRKGYKLRNTSDSNLALSINGAKTDPTTAIPLKEGWGIMSYLLEDPVNVATAFSDISTQTIIVKDILGKAYFPFAGANALGNMVAGQGYQVKMREEAQLFYAAPNTNSLPAVEQPTDKNRPSQSIRSVEGPAWEVTHTGENHTLIISPGLTGTFNGQNLQVGDYVGVFYERDGRLISGGKARWTGDNIALAAFADDPTTEVKDGFAEGETFTWKIWREADGHEETVAADYMDLDRVISHTDRFTFDGVSGVGLQQTLATSLSDFQIEGIKLYPNPSNGTFWLELPTDLTDMKLNVFNYTGQLVIQTQDIPVGKSMIELSNQPEGVYILQLVGSQQTLTDRIVLRR